MDKVVLMTIIVN